MHIFSHFTGEFQSFYQILTPAITYQRLRTSASAYPERIAHILSHFDSSANSLYQNLAPVTTSRMPSLTISPITDFPHVFLQNLNQDNFRIYHILLRSRSLDKYLLSTYSVPGTMLYRFRYTFSPIVLLEEDREHHNIQYVSCNQGHMVVVAPLNGKNEQWHFSGCHSAPEEHVKPGS